MKILVVADVSIGKVIGGAERVLFEQSMRLAQRGHVVHILTRGLRRNEDKLIHGITESGYGVTHTTVAAFMSSTFLNGRRTFERIHKKHGFDRMIIHQPFSALGAISSHHAAKIRKFYVCHSLSFEEFISRNPKPKNVSQQMPYLLNILFRKAIERHLLGKAERIVVLSRFTKRKLMEKHHIRQGKIIRIPGGTDLVKFRPATASERAGIRHGFGISPNEIVLFTVRNLVPRMGLENLLFALKSVIGTGANVRLIIGGEGPLKEKLVGLSTGLEMGGRIVFPGFIPEEKLPDYYRCADLFVLPTRELEGFGLVTVEALASGLPVVGTPVGGTLEILGELDAGLLFDDTGPESMARRIMEKCEIIRNDPFKWDELRKKCRAHAENRYSWETHADVLRDILQSQY